MYARSRSAVPITDYHLWPQNELWVSFIAKLSLGKAVAVANCRQVFSAWVDSNGHTFGRATLCQKRDVCPTCAWVYNEELVAGTLELYRLLCNAVGKSIRFAEGTFTLPPSAQRLVGDDMLGVIRRIGFETVNEVLNEDGRLVLGGVGSTHHWHSKQPLKGWFPHTDLTLLGLAYEKDRDRFVPLDLFLNKGRLERLTEAWRASFMENVGEVRTKRFVAHWGYGSGFATAEHRYRYQFRRPLAETFDVIVGMGKVDSVNVEWAKRLLTRPKNEKRHQWYGYLSDGIKSRYLQKLGVSIDSKTARDRTRRKAPCPDCGEELVCVGHGISYEELSKDPSSRVLTFRNQRRAGS